MNIFESKDIDFIMTVTDSTIILKPKEPLRNYEYNRLKPYMESMHSHWRERFGGFVFYTDFLKMSEEQKHKEQTSFFRTPDELASVMVDLLGELPDRVRLLEPSAGDGSLLNALPKDRQYDLTVIEPDESCVAKLKKQGYSPLKQDFVYVAENLLELGQTFDYILMNPPFAGRRDIMHTMLAYRLLSPGGTMVAIVSENAMYYKDYETEKFNKWISEVGAVIHPTKEGSFYESGTMIDVVILEIHKPV